MLYGSDALGGVILVWTKARRPAAGDPAAAGLAGALTTTASFLVPTGLIALAVERYGARHHRARWHVAIRQALVPITIGFLISTGCLLGAVTLTPGGIGLALATIAVLMRTRWSPLWLTALGALLGALGLV